jgi:hypothetical protein
VLLIGEFIPFGVILPTISPALFGSVAAGTLVTATSSTLASSVNFWLGRSFLSGAPSRPRALAPLRRCAAAFACALCGAAAAGGRQLAP